MNEQDKEREHRGRSGRACDSIGAAKPTPVKIDVERHLASRKAMRDVLNRQKVFICSQRFAEGKMRSTRVLVRGDYYDVNDHQLAQLQGGLSPADLMLEPVLDER